MEFFLLYKMEVKLLFLLALFFYSQISFCERLILSPAEKVLLPLPPNKKVRVGDKSLMAIQIEQGWLSLLARKEGQTLLTTGQTKYEIFIFNKEQKFQALQLDQLLKNFWGLSWSLADNKIFQITGQLNRLYDWIELAKTSQKHNILYEFKASPGEELEKPIRHYFQSLFKDKTPPEIIWQKLPLAHIPQGEKLSEYEKLLQPFGLTPKEDPLWFSTAPFIEIEIALVESLSSSGFSFGGLSHSDHSLSRFSSLLSFLNFLKNSGQGKTLHHSSIVSQSGQKLQIHSGGQIPFNNYNLKTEQKNTQWKSHGFHLNIIPRAGKNHQIELDIKAQISEPLSLSSMDRPPPLKTQSLENKLVLKNKQILNLFQLHKQSQGTQSQGQLSFFWDFPSSLFRGNNKYKMTQFIFIQAQIADKSRERASFTKKKHTGIFKRAF